MAKRKTKNPEPKAHWAHEDTVELFAWLDHTIQHDDISFDETVVDHLKQSRPKEFTLAQIECKLRGLWHDYGSNDPSRSGIGWKEGLFKYGSSCIGLSNDERQDISSSLRGLEAGYEAIHLSPSHHLRRRLRPTKAYSSLYPNFKSLESSRNTMKVHPRYRTQTLSLTPSTVKGESETIDKSPSCESLSGKRKRATPNRYRAVTAGYEQLPPDPRPAITTIQKPALPTTAPHPASVVCDSEEAEEELTVEPRVLGRQKIGEGGSPSDSEPDDQHDVKYDNQTLSKLEKKKLDTAVAEIERLREQLNQKESEIRDQEESARMTEDRIAMLESIQSEWESHDGESISLLIQKNRSLQDLQHELKERRSLGRFTKLLPSSREFFSEENGGTNVVEGFYNIYSESKQILCRYDGSNAVTSELFNQHNNLLLLVCRGLGIDLQTTLKIDKSVIDVSKLRLQAIFRALMTSVLREWIFETDFPKFDTESSKVLLKYREHLAKQDGANCVRNLDLAAHNSLIKDGDFRRGLPKKASELAVKLSQTLAPIFAQDSDVPLETTWDGFATWGQDIEECRERRSRLAGIFTKALEVKADSIVNTVDYEMVMYPPGTKYDKNAMTVETMDGMADPTKYHDRRIELCIEAAIYLYPRKDLQDSAIVTEAIVKSKNFMRKEASHRIGVTPIVKAVVILKEEPLGDLGA